MPYIKAEDRTLTVLNLFTTDVAEKQDLLLGEMRRIVDTAAFPGWISSTVHSGEEKFGTANFIQWRSGKDLELRYAGDEFRHRTVPLFGEMTTSMRLTRNEVVYTQRHPSLGDVTEISPDRDDYTVIEFYGVAEENQDELVDTLGPSHDWLLDTPGYRSHTVLRGLGARGYDGAFVLAYSQWDDKESYDAYRAQPEAERPAGRVSTQARVDALATSYDWNTYRVVHTRSASDSTPA
ncbi:MAG TPA: antibiotic biosynthesis monooxygenase [Mycobacteriales bacterium]|nr:antibiotic biosynthesis monooxygenase [Mycobacteriales bacterium]